ncbi:MAG: alpha-L-fucosidase [Agriterribacter sp.]
MRNIILVTLFLSAINTSIAQQENNKPLQIQGALYTRNIVEAVFKTKVYEAVHFSYSWYIASTPGGPWEKLPGINTNKIVLLSSYANKYLKCQMTANDKYTKVQLSAETISPGTIKDKDNPHTDWFKNAGFGLMIHFLSDVYAKDGGSAAWNAVVDGFDTEKFAEDCKQSGVGYVMFALGQNSGYYCSPNKAYDSIVDAVSGELCSKRDLPADLYASLKKRNIRMMFYLPGNPPISNKRVTDKFKYTFKKDSPTSPFTQACWEAVIKEWSLRYGKKLSGWWFDGMYSGGIIETRSDMSLPHNISTHTLAAKAGNPESIVTYNYGVKKMQSNSPYDDYSAGEKQELDEVPQSRWVAPGVQWFFFTYLGKWWSGEGTRFTTDTLTQWAQQVFEKEGVLCFDVHAQANGNIDPSQLQQLQAIKVTFETVKAKK